MTVQVWATGQDILDLVARYLAEEFAGDGEDAPRIVEEDAGGKPPWWEAGEAQRPKSEWWTLPVVSPLENRCRLEYYGRLAEVEQRILEREGLDVELMPATPPDPR